MSDSDSDWKYDLDEVGEEAEDDPRDLDFDLDPGSPSAENAFFVALGVLTMLAVFGRLFLLAV